MKDYNHYTRIGQTGEQAVLNYLQKNWIVEDTTKNPEYFDKDIDFIITSKKDPTFVKKIEVKTDRQIHLWHNLFVERYTRVEKPRKLGWFYTCQADELYYYDYCSHELHIVNLFYLRNFIEANKKWLQVKHTGYFESQDKTSDGWIVPLDKLKQFCHVSSFILHE